MRTNPVILLALLCCAMVCTAKEIREFRCMYDDVATTSGEKPARIVESGPDSGKKGATTGDGTSEWEAIRFKVFSEDLNDAKRYCTAKDQERPTFTAPSDVRTCRERDVLTDEKKSTLLNDMIPAALKLHSDRLLVQRVTGKLKVPVYDTGFCGSMRVPKSHNSDGVVDADMVMYTAAGPTGDAGAWAGTCSRVENRRPVVGFMNIGPAIIGTGRMNIRIAAHEIAHALGFDVQTMYSLDLLPPSGDPGKPRSVVKSGGTRREAGAHYGCPSISGMKLDIEGVNGDIRSHWKRRNARGELMTGVVEGGYYTALTMAVFDDMGFIKANWGMEETMEWGREKGCVFLEEKCVINGTTKYPDMFCTERSSSKVCAFDRKGLGTCGLMNYPDDLPFVFQYFDDPTIGGTEETLDYCPIVVRYENAGCKDGYTEQMPGSRVGPSSMCLKGEGLRLKDQEAGAVQDVCAEIKCNGDSVSVRYSGDDKWHKCPEGTTITPKGSFSAGSIVCPSYSEVCGGSDGVGFVSSYFLPFVLIWVTFLIF